MSLEESMKELAASNVALAEAQNALAEAQTEVAGKYGELLTFLATNAGTSVAVDTAPAKEDKPAGAKRGPKPKTKPEPVDDGLEGEEEEEEQEDSVTFDQMKDKLKAANKVDRDATLALMAKYGYKSVAEIQEKDYQKLHDGAIKIAK